MSKTINLYELSQMKECLCYLYGIEPRLLDKFICACDDNQDIVYQFCEAFGVHLDEVDISSNNLLCKHITTAIDEGKSIEENGLLSLKQLLSTKSVLSEFLYEHGVLINIEKMTIRYKLHKELSISSGDQRIMPELSLVANTLCSAQGSLEAFCAGSLSEMLNYSQVKDFPEFIEKTEIALSRLYIADEFQLVEDWKARRNRQMLIEFVTPLSNLWYCSGFEREGMLAYHKYMKGSYELIEEIPMEAVYNRWIIRHMLMQLLQNEPASSLCMVGIEDTRQTSIVKMYDLHDV